jgi:hypothetical protein
MELLHPAAQVALSICVPLAIAWIITTIAKEA